MDKLIVTITEDDIKNTLISKSFSYDAERQINKALSGSGMDNILNKIVEEKLREVIDKIDMESIKNRALDVFETKFRTIAKRMIDSMRDETESK